MKGSDSAALLMRPSAAGAPCFEISTGESAGELHMRLPVIVGNIKPSSLLGPVRTAVGGCRERTGGAGG